MKMTNKQPKQHRSQISFTFCCCSFSQKVKNKNYLFKLFVSVVVEEFFFSCYCFQLEIAYNYLAFFVHDTPPKNADESTHAFDLNTLIWYPLLCCCCSFPSSRLLSSNACLGEWYQPTLMLLCINLIILLWTKKEFFLFVMVLFSLNDTLDAGKETPFSSTGERNANYDFIYVWHEYLIGKYGI